MDEALLRCAPAAASNGPVALPSNMSTTFSPVAFGADPSGRTDSTSSMSKALAALFRVCDDARLQPSRHLAFNITDCGGATLDLQAMIELVGQISDAA